MAVASKDDNVFRFVHLRGVAPGERDASEGGSSSEEQPRRDRPADRDRPAEDEEERGIGGSLARWVTGILGGPGRARLDSADVGETSSGVSAWMRSHGGPTLIRAAVAAKRELESLRPGMDLVLPSDDNTSSRQELLTLTETGQSRLSETARSLLESLLVDGIAQTPVTTLIATLDNLIASAPTPSIGTATMQPQPESAPRITSVGVAELLVVKQQITRYEPAEIAHIENVLTGEAKVRTHRKLDRLEEEIVTSNEESVTQERELESTERFELNKEATTTTQKDQQRGFGLSLSGKYGPTVEFSSELNLQNGSSQTESTRNAVNYAKDVVERSREAVVTSVREERRRRLLREVEEVNEHSLTNTGGSHISGVYQFLDKVYTSQVFNYGLREMFDFLVPEPASYLIHLNNAPRTDIELPVPPVELTAYVADASGIEEYNYLELGARYNVEGLTPPPPAWLIRRQGVTHGQGDLTEEGQPRSFETIEVDIPQGYKAIVAEVSAVLTSDETPTLIITIGNEVRVITKTVMTEVDLSQGNLKAYTSSVSMALTSEDSDYVAQEKLAIHAFANESANYVVKAKVFFWRQELPIAWRIKTYEKVAEAYRNLRLQYEQDVEEIRARQAQQFSGTDDFGSPPERNLRMIKGELKKHCVAVLRGTHDNSLSTAHSGGTAAEDPPLFDIPESLSDGSRIRFLETAFEWDQMQYACYPYFWARSDGWPERFHVRNLDPVFEEFLRAGSARVVVPVRPGLEAAVAYFLKTGEPWKGEGEPDVQDPLYRPIVEEIKERSGGGKGEIPVGAPWETRLPTVAVKLRKDDALPEWELRAGSDWDWDPKP